MFWSRRSSNQRFRKPARRAPSRRAARTRLEFEPLETRLVLATLTWTGSDGTDWSDAKNWGGSVPANGDSLVFDSTAAKNLASNNDLANLSVAAVNFSGAAGGFDLKGGPLTITGGINAANAAGVNTIDLPVVLGSSQTFTVGSGAQLNLGGTLSGNSGLTKAGAGTLDLTQTNTYTGNTVVGAGTLLVDGTTGNVQLAGGTLGGTGTVGDVSITGGANTISPGSADLSGVLTSSAVTLNGSSTFHALLDGAAPGNGANSYSQLSSTGAVNLGGATLSATLGFPLGVDASFTLVQSTGPITGKFAQGSSMVLNGQEFQITYNTNSVVLSVANTSTTLMSTANPVNFNQQVTFTATVDPVPGVTGFPTTTVGFYDGITLIGTGTLTNVNGHQQATYSTSALSIGSHPIMAVYGGDANFNGSKSAVLTQQVSTLPTTTTISAPLNAVGLGAPITLTAVVSGTGAGIPGGTVKFFDGGTQIGSDTVVTVNGQQQASITTSLMSFGNRLLTAAYTGDSTYSSSTSSPFVLLVGNSQQRYVNQLYQDLLHRSADSQGAIYWSGLLFTGTSPTLVAEAIINSPEHQAVVIQSIFQQYLNRSADPATLSAFTQYLASGGTLDDLRAIVLGSNEYYQLHGGTSGSFASALYHDLLGRPIDAAAQSAIAAELSSGASRSTVAAQVMSQTEYRQDLVQSFYQRYLGRSAETAGLNYAVGRLAAGATEDQLLAAIVSAPEYYNRLGP